jgi:hypothetical protein
MEAVTKMTGAERIAALLNGQASEAVADDLGCCDGQFHVRTVKGPFQRMIDEGKSAEILAKCHEHPEAGAELVAGYVDATAKDIAITEDDSQAIWYVLGGCEPAYSTPMQYGGLFLEWDRELLTRANETQKVFLHAAAGKDAYLDFIADLPATCFVWDDVATGVSLSEMRSMRGGLLACSDPNADLVLSAEKLMRLANQKGVTCNA